MYLYHVWISNAQSLELQLLLKLHCKF